MQTVGTVGGKPDDGKRRVGMQRCTGSARAGSGRKCRSESRWPAPSRRERFRLWPSRGRAGNDKAQLSAGLKRKSRARGAALTKLKRCYIRPI